MEPPPFKIFEFLGQPSVNRFSPRSCTPAASALLPCLLPFSLGRNRTVPALCVQNHVRICSFLGQLLLSALPGIGQSGPDFWIARLCRCYFGGYQYVTLCASPPAGEMPSRRHHPTGHPCCSPEHGEVPLTLISPQSTDEPATALCQRDTGGSWCRCRSRRRSQSLAASAEYRFLPIVGRRGLSMPNHKGAG